MGDDSNLAMEFRDRRLINWFTRRPRISSDRAAESLRGPSRPSLINWNASDRGRERARANPPSSGMDSVRCGRKVPTAIEETPVGIVWATDFHARRVLSRPTILPRPTRFPTSV